MSRRAALLGLAGIIRARSAQSGTLYFEPNRGQFGEGSFGTDQSDWQGLFGAGRLVFLAKRLLGDPGPTGAAPVRIGQGQADLSLSLLGASPQELLGEDLRQGKSNYYFHGDPKTFLRNTPHFSRLRYREAWQGLDLVVRGWERLIEITPVCSGDPSTAAFRWSGAKLGQDGAGRAVVSAKWGRVSLAPAQDRNGRRLPGAWRLDEQGALRFA
jgi:hypothetical protein